MLNAEASRFIKELKESPVYAMSLGSKELFHSNFWAWLIEGDNKFAQVFFENNLPYENLKVEREQGNRDLTIWYDEKACVVENKLKSLPSKEQLEKYQEALGEKFGGGVLTGITEPPFELTNDEWHFISYSKIAEKLKVICEKSDKDIIKDNKDIIGKYCVMTEKISALLKNLCIADNKFIYENIEDLHKIRLHDIYMKLRAENFLEYFKREYKDEIQKLSVSPNGYELCMWTYFSKGKAGIDIKYCKEVSDGMRSIGVQIEHYQFRLCVEYRPGNKYAKEWIFNEFSSEANKWFDIDFEEHCNRTVFGKQTKMSPRGGNKYNSYATSEYTFVYQYFDIEEGMSYDCLCEKILEAIKKAQKHV